MKHYDLKPVLKSYIILESIVSLFALLNLIEGIRRGDAVYSVIFALAFIAVLTVNLMEVYDYRNDGRLVNTGVLDHFGRYLNSNKAVLYQTGKQPVKFRIMGLPQKEMITLLGKKVEVHRTKNLKNAVEIKVLD